MKERREIERDAAMQVRPLVPQPAQGRIGGIAVLLIAWLLAVRVIRGMTEVTTDNVSSDLMKMLIDSGRIIHPAFAPSHGPINGVEGSGVVPAQAFAVVQGTAEAGRDGR